MNLYLIERADKEYFEFNSYHCGVVSASNEEEARSINLDKSYSTETDKLWHHKAWCAPEEVVVTLIGESYIESKGVICASFNAG